MGLRAEAAGLFVLALALTIPVPTALARARWPARDPRVALVCWQAVGLAGGLSLLGGALTLVAGSLSDRWLAGLGAIPNGWTRLGAAGWTGMVLAVALAIWLGMAAASSTIRVVLARHAHRARLDAVADHWQNDPSSLDGHEPDLTSPQLATNPARPAELRLLDHPTAVAYCLPGLRPRIVVSHGAVVALDRAELDAVVAHEQTHARGHHDLLVQPFVAWQRTFPFLTAPTRALQAVELSVEMLADDGACQHCEPTDLAHALQRLGDEPLAVGLKNTRRMQTEMAQRVARLVSPPSPLPLAARAALYLAAVALVCVPPVILMR